MDQEPHDINRTCCTMGQELHEIIRACCSFPRLPVITQNYVFVVNQDHVLIDRGRLLENGIMLGLHQIPSKVGPIYELKNFGFLWPVSSRQTFIARSQASIYIDVRERLTYEWLKKCIIGQVIRVTCNRITTDLRARDSRDPRKSIGIHWGTRITNTAVIHLRPTIDWLVMLWDQLATDPRPGRDRLELSVWLGKSLPEIKISRKTCDQFTILPNEIRGHRVIYDQHAKTCNQRRIQLWVGSLANKMDVSDG